MERLPDLSIMTGQPSQGRSGRVGAGVGTGTTKGEENVENLSIREG